MVIKIVQSQFNLWPKEIKRVFETIIMDHRSSQITTGISWKYMKKILYQFVALKEMLLWNDVGLKPMKISQVEILSRGTGNGCISF